MGTYVAKRQLHHGNPLRWRRLTVALQLLHRWAGLLMGWSWYWLSPVFSVIGSARPGSIY